MSGRVPPSRRVRAAESLTAKERRAFERAAKLYADFTGHDAEPMQRVRVDVPSVALCVGECDGVLYTTVRDGQTEKYIHKFKAKSRPLLCVSPDGKVLFLIGGGFTFTERGIVDN